jgi:hypothetical protein
MLPILQAFQSFHREIRVIQEQRQAIDPLYQAISFVSQSSGHPEDLIQKVMQAAKKLRMPIAVPFGCWITKLMNCGQLSAKAMVLGWKHEFRWEKALWAGCSNGSGGEYCL